MHIDRQRAQAAYDLIDYYGQFARENTSQLDALKKEGREGRRQVAVILRRLTTVAKEVNLPSADKVCTTSSLLLFSNCVYSYRRVKVLRNTVKNSRRICYTSLIDVTGKGTPK